MRAPAQPRSRGAGPAGPAQRGTGRPAPRTVERTSPGTEQAPAPGHADGRTSAPSEPVAREGGVQAQVPTAWAGAALARLARAPGVVSDRFEQRLSERRAARRRLAATRIAGAAVVLLVTGLLAWVVLASPLLALRADQVAVTTTGPAVDSALVVDVVAPSAGTPLARVPTAQLAASIERLPGVLEASVRRAWPHGLDVDVVARVPIAAVPQGDRLLLLDREGVQVGDPVATAPEGVPVVAVLPGRSADAVHAVIEVLDSLPPDLAAEVTSAGADSADTVGFVLADGSRVQWGSREFTELKVRVLAVLRQRPASVYDVSAPTMPVTR